MASQVDRKIERHSALLAEMYRSESATKMISVMRSYADWLREMRRTKRVPQSLVGIRFVTRLMVGSKDMDIVFDVDDAIAFSIGSLRGYADALRSKRGMAPRVKTREGS